MSLNKEKLKKILSKALPPDEVDLVIEQYEAPEIKSYGQIALEAYEKITKMGAGWESSSDTRKTAEKAGAQAVIEAFKERELHPIFVGFFETTRLRLVDGCITAVDDVRLTKLKQLLEKNHAD